MRHYREQYNSFRSRALYLYSIRWAMSDISYHGGEIMKLLFYIARRNLPNESMPRAFVHTYGNELAQNISIALHIRIFLKWRRSHLHY